MSVRHVLSATTTCVLAVSGLATKSAFAMPVGQPADARAAAVVAPSAEMLEAAGVDFTGIVALNDCSGALVRFVNSAPTDKAMVITNGHCIETGFLNPGEVRVDRASTRAFRLLNAAATSTLATLHADRVLYATMTDTDMTLYRLTQTFADIEGATGTHALTISDQHPAPGAPIRVVSGYWKKIYSCTIDRFVYRLKEGNWTFKDSVRYTQPGCETIGGTSGSPIVHADSHEVIGINNTGNDNGERCTEDNPCEVDEAGNVVVEKGASYGQELYLIYTCLSPTNTLDLTVAGCELPKPARNLRLVTAAP